MRACNFLACRQERGRRGASNTSSNRKVVRGLINIVILVDVQISQNEVEFFVRKLGTFSAAIGSATLEIAQASSSSYT